MSLRAFRSGDIDMLLGWFSAPHVARWWDVTSEAALAQKYEARLSPDSPVDVFIIEAQGRPVGMLQAAYGVDGVGADECGLDLLIGDAGALRRGYGAAAIACFIAQATLHRSKIGRFIADPAIENIASTRAFERAGFAAVDLPQGRRWVRRAGEVR